MATGIITDPEKYQRLFTYVQYDTSLKNTFANAIRALDNNLPSNRTYLIMIIMNGSYAGTFEGMMSVTDTAIRFFVAYETIIYSGGYIKSSQTVFNLCQINVTNI